MKTIHLRKLNAIMEVKSRTLFSKNLIIMPAFSLVFTWLLKMIYTNMYPDLDFGSYALSIGLLMNTSMTGIYCVSAMLAEEKRKKHTAHPYDLLGQRTGILPRKPDSRRAYDRSSQRALRPDRTGGDESFSVGCLPGGHNCGVSHLIGCGHDLWNLREESGVRQHDHHAGNPHFHDGPHVFPV